MLPEKAPLNIVVKFKTIINLKLEKIFQKISETNIFKLIVTNVVQR